MKRWIAVTFGLNCLIAPLAAQDSAFLAPDRSLDSLLNTKVSAAAKYDQTVRQVAGSITIVTAEDIRRFGYRSLDEILQSSAGFYLTYNREYDYIGVRGFGRSNDHNNRILLLLDGHTSNEGLTGSSQFVFVAQGRLVLGRWQGIFFCEYDGPRERTMQIKIVPDPD